MEEQELLWSSSQQELVRGIALRDGQYRCLLCGAVFPQGEVFPRGGRFYDAEAMAALHLREAHGSVLEYLLHRNPGLLGLSEVQLELLRMLAEGCTDKEIAAQKRVSPSTVRNHRFKLREKERQARLFLALMELLRTSRISSPVDTGFCHPHPTASMVDARYAVTEEERQGLLAARVLAGRVWGDGKTPPPYGKLYFFRCGACAVALCVSLLLDCFVVPGLVSSLAGTFLSL